MAGDGSSWLDSAFEDEAPTSREIAPQMADGAYDWIDDAFDDEKPDPLARKGLTGRSRLVLLACIIALLAFLTFAALIGFNWYALAAAPR